MLSVARGVHLAQVLSPQPVKRCIATATMKKTLKRAALGKKSSAILLDEVRESLKFAKDIMDTVREPFLVLDAKLRVVSANPAFYRTFKVRKKETEGTLIYKLGNSQWNIPKLRTLLEAILPKKSELTDFEVSHCFPAIGGKIMLLNARRIDNVEFILLAIEDITERQRLQRKVADSEKRFRSLIEKSSDAFALVNPQGKVLYASPSTRNVMGYTEKELKKFANPFEVAPPDHKRLVTKLFEEILHKPYASATVEYKVRHKNGTYIWIESIMTNLLDDPGAQAIVLNYRNVTHRKELERQKDDFIGVASHELKTPVTSIKAYTQLLKKQFEKDGNEKAAQNFAKMDAQINKLNMLIGDLLDVTKIESGKIIFNAELFDFDRMVRETVESMRLTTDRHAIHIKGAVRRKVLADRERIGMVLVNLLTNAIKYSPRSVKIYVRVSADRKTVTVGVQDFGIGIEEQKQRRVFERFYRVQSVAGEGAYGGLGLGLYIAFEIVKRHGGKMWLKSAPGKGSTFFFSIPIRGNSDMRKSRKMVS